MEINKIYQGDCLEIMKTIESESIDCVITSPPYNKGYYDKHTPSEHDVWKQRNIKYGEFGDDLEPEEYVKQQNELLKELTRVIKPTGSIFYNTKAVIANHKLIYPSFVFDFNVRQQIIWDRGSSPQLAPIRWFPTAEYIFWITKTNVQPKFYRRGKQDKEVWKISPQPFPEHPAPFPDELVYECMIATTDEGDLVLDPYFGSGTTGLVAKTIKRNFIGIELNKTYIDLAEKRIKQYNPLF